MTSKPPRLYRMLEMHAIGLWFVISALLLPLCLGCQHQGCPVQGEVTFEGQPVEDGTVTFEPADGQGPTAGGRISTGRYSIDSDAAPLPGKKIVRIFGVRKTGRRFNNFMTGMTDEVVPCIPNVYNSRSTLSCELARNGQSQMDFHLKKSADMAVQHLTR